MELRFEADAKIIIQRGARLTANNSTLTSLDCPGARWPGIRVEGNSADLTQSTTEQGKLFLTNSIVEHAEVGVWRARQVDIATPAGGSFGGRVLALGSTFRTCID
ncbi:MAG: hypothetical protein IPL52_11285 [Flavobacteriales bacterium]|nr:hypothetical protein [Flavobacteriales bacterium]